jgi:hypothetical protein
MPGNPHPSPPPSTNSRFDYDEKHFFAWRITSGATPLKAVRKPPQSRDPVTSPASSIMKTWDRVTENVELALGGGIASSASRETKSPLLGNLPKYPAAALGQFVMVDKPWCTGVIVSKGRGKANAKVLTAAHWCAAPPEDLIKRPHRCFRRRQRASNRAAHSHPRCPRIRLPPVPLTHPQSHAIQLLGHYRQGTLSAIGDTIPSPGD